ncbi:MAG: tail fiber protein [Cyanobacteria bacterium J06648_11]
MLVVEAAEKNLTSLFISGAFAVIPAIVQPLVAWLLQRKGAKGATKRRQEGKAKPAHDPEDTEKAESAAKPDTTRMVTVNNTVTVANTITVVSITLSITFALIYFVPGLLSESTLVKDPAAVEVDADRVAAILLDEPRLLDALAEDPRFRGEAGADGKAGLRGERGMPGAQGPKGDLGAASIGLPIGSVVAWPGEFPGDEGETWFAPDGSGWRVCNGDSLSDVAYSELLEAFPDRDGDGQPDWPYGTDGPSKFKLPDFQGLFLRGFGRLDDDHRSGKLGVMQPDTVSLDYLDRSATWKPHHINNPEIVLGKDDRYDHQALVRVDKSGYFGTETRPVNVAVHWIIRVK